MAGAKWNRGLAQALVRRLEFERLFGIEEVYVSAKRRSGSGSGKAAPEESEKPRPPEPRRAPDFGELSRAVPATSRAQPRAAGKAEPREQAAEARAEPEFVIEEAPGAGLEELSLFSEAEREGIPRVSTETGSSTERLAKLASAASSCTRCHLCRTRTNVVFGEGSPEADLVFVGEAPGADEDATGRPFVGRAGKLLTRIIEAMGLAREDVYICNVLKCRPPGNRAPAPEEVLHCSPFLHEQLGVIGPKVVCALGGPATKELLGAKEGITKLRGRFFRYRGIPLMPTFHPAYLLRSSREKGKVWEDMQKIMAFLGKPIP